MPTGYTTVCIDERSQLANKKEAIARLKIHYMEQKAALEADGKREKWTQHNNLERGDAVACFRGEKFVRV